VHGDPDLPDSSGFDFISLESSRLDAQVGDWFGTLFLAIGALSLFAAALGIIDYVSRLVADVVRVGYASESPRWTESRIYLTVVWMMIVFGSAILLAGFDQPLVLVTISTVLGGFIMFVYSCLLVVTNRRYLPDPLKLRGYRLAVIGCAILVLGATTVIVGIDQFGALL
jgi:tryptophan-rich sensory protein